MVFYWVCICHLPRVTAKVCLFASIYLGSFFAVPNKAASRLDHLACIHCYLQFYTVCVRIELRRPGIQWKTRVRATRRLCNSQSALLKFVLAVCLASNSCKTGLITSVSLGWILCWVMQCDNLRIIWYIRFSCLAEISFISWAIGAQDIFMSKTLFATTLQKVWLYSCLVRLSTTNANVIL